MTVNVGVMQLPVTEDPDPVRTYLNGTHASGGLWTALTRASNHDHSGGLSGVQLGATSIPDGSITAAKLDPSVLLPYALVDGSKPFTGTVTMNADQLIRDTLRFGAKPAGVADATLARTGAGALRVDTHLGVGVNPAAWGGTYRAVQVGLTGAIRADTATAGVFYQENSYSDGTNNRALVAGGASLVNLGGGTVSLYTAPSVAAGAVQTFTQRAILSQPGTLSLTPATGSAALDLNTTDDAAAVFLTFSNQASGRWAWYMQSDPGGSPLSLYSLGAAGGGFTERLRMAHTGTLSLSPAAGEVALLAGQAGSDFVIASQGGSNLKVSPAGFVFSSVVDNRDSLGFTGLRWTYVHAAAGTIQTSSADLKEAITPLDPLACYQAAKDVRWYEYAYLPPAYTPPEPPPDIAYDAADDNETKAEKKAARDEAEAKARELHAKMLVETAPARHQRGFVFPAGAESKDEAGGALPPVPDLFGLSDRESTTPQADLATLGCALQEVIRRLEALEAPN
jgi:hypothetical protein